MNVIVKPEFLNGIKAISEMYYRRARRTQDQFTKAYLQNCALYKSTKVAKQETLKEFQRRFHNGEFTRDSSSVFSAYDNNSLGLDPSEIKRIGSSGTGKVVGGINRNFVSEASLTRDYLREYKILEFFNKRPSTRESDVVVAWTLVSSNYVSTLSDEDLKRWQPIIAEIEAISTHSEKHNVRWSDLYVYLDVTRYSLEAEHRVFKKDFKTLMDNLDNLQNIFIAK